eukprot:2674074-Lingulodinium_polyedra.AAC.1
MLLRGQTAGQDPEAGATAAAAAPREAVVAVARAASGTLQTVAEVVVASQSQRQAFGAPG